MKNETMIRGVNIKLSSERECFFQVEAIEFSCFILEAENAGRERVLFADKLVPIRRMKIIQVVANIQYNNADIRCVSVCIYIYIYI